MIIEINTTQSKRIMLLIKINKYVFPSIMSFPKAALKRW